MAAKKKSKAAKKSGGKSGGSEFIVKSKVKEFLAGSECRSSSDVADALNGVVAWYLEQAAKRCKANKRSTVRSYDVCCM